MRTISIMLISLLVLSACNSDYTVRKKGYFSIDFPEHAYQLYHAPGAPYSFEYPVYATVLQDTLFFDEKPENPWWINIDFPGFNGKIYISYKNIRNEEDFHKLVNDAYNLTYKHTSKATAIGDSLFTTPNGVAGVYFRVAGNAATQHQFFLTDSIRHFLRGALYFDATPNEDSLRIVYDFLHTDLQHLIQTLKWER